MAASVGAAPLRRNSPSPLLLRSDSPPVDSTKLDDANAVLMDEPQHQHGRLPSGHFAYVKNVKPGMPLFLFNYSNRKMHGIFEAACAGQLNIDQFAWSDDGRIKTQFPAQVRISTRAQCLPVSEAQFKSVISGNYHKFRHFYFELDHSQTRALISLFKPAQVHDVPNKSSYFRSLQPPTAKAHLVPGRVKYESCSKDFNQCVVPSDSQCMDAWKCYGNAELLHIIDKLSRRTEAVEKKLVESDKEILFLRETVKDTRRRVQQLENQMEKLQSTSNSSAPLIGKPHSDIEGPHIFLIGGYRGGLCLSSLETFCPTTDRLMPLRPMSSVRAYAFVAALKDQIYVFGGGDGSSWYHTGKYSKQFAPAAVELNGALYVTGGYDGNTSAERYDPREGFWTLLPSMTSKRGSHSVALLGEAIYAVGGHDGNNLTSTVEIYDARANSWRIGSPFSIARGYSCAATMNDNLYLIGGLNDAGETINTVEVYNERQGWSISSCEAIGRRAFACAIAI
ncbi:hypothetical protein PR202_gb26338 [Eleusine coracana subsp. coracana]|uniref:DCD domain-containing protein n=1 Tax=Eleusine coracana subsp. coracana TaxID=191504 RepID=A0AAV5FQX2_ELECO|nr:hypothetical protein PR202_gb26338 [Eleusine coracana subsp. coracana]